MPRHPAKFSPRVLNAFRMLLQDRGLVLDPFAGTGKIHSVTDSAIGVEIEPEWASMHPKTIVGDATALPFRSWAFGAVATSPCYGNRMADHHNAKDGSVRHTYTHALGRQLHENNAGQMQWGKAYRNLHTLAWAECYRVLRPFGVLVLNVSDHIRGGEVVHVCQWHRETLESLNFVLIDDLLVDTPRLRHGENADVRVEGEHVMVFLRRAERV